MSELWTLKKINQLIADNEPETLHLEYKSAAALDFKADQKNIREFSKDISAFTNSDGGVVIYGVREVEKYNLF